MKNLTKWTETGANIAIIIVAVFIVGVLVQKSFVPKRTVPEPNVPAIGRKISLDSFDWSAQSKTVALVLQKGCKFCTASAPFYKRLLEKAVAQNVKVLAVLPGKTEDSKSYLHELGIPELELRESSLGPLKVNGTPTILFVNNQGEITESWVGRLPPEKEAEVLKKL